MVDSSPSRSKLCLQVSLHFSPIQVPPLNQAPKLRFYPAFCKQAAPQSRQWRVQVQWWKIQNFQQVHRKCSTNPWEVSSDGRSPRQKMPSGQKPRKETMAKEDSPDLSGNPSGFASESPAKIVNLSRYGASVIVFSSESKTWIIQILSRDTFQTGLVSEPHTSAAWQPGIGPSRLRTPGLALELLQGRLEFHQWRPIHTIPPHPLPRISLPSSKQHNRFPRIFQPCWGPSRLHAVAKAFASGPLTLRELFWSRSRGLPTHHLTRTLWHEAFKKKTVKKKSTKVY